MTTSGDFQMALDKRFPRRRCFDHSTPPRSWLIADRNLTTRPLRSTPITGASPLLRDGPPSCPATGTPPLTALHRLRPLPLASRHQPRLPISGRGVLLFRVEAWTGLAPPICRTPPEQ